MSKGKQVSTFSSAVAAESLLLDSLQSNNDSYDSTANIFERTQHKEILSQQHTQKRRRLSSQDFRSLVAISSADMVCFEFARPIPCSLNPQDLVERIYTTSSSCLEASLAFALARGFETVDDVIDLPLVQLLPRAHGYEELFRRWHGLSLSGQGFEVSLKTADGQDLIVQAVMYGKITDDHLTRVWLILRDVTAQTRTLQALSQYAKVALVGQFSAGMSHDLNNHLTAIRCQLEVATSLTPPDSPALESLSAALQAVDGCHHMGQQLMMVGRGGNFKPGPIKILQVIQDSLRLVRYLLPARISLHFDPTPDDITVWADAVQLQQAFINLILNARDAISAAGTIQIAWERVSYQHSSQASQASHASQSLGSFVRISIADTGAGIAADVAPRIFDPFFSTKLERGGNGLGLSMIKSIVEAHDGSISFKSSAAGGTTFFVFLPIFPNQIEAIHVDDIHKSMQGSSSLGGLDLVIAEDDDAIRSMLLSVLTSMGHRVVVVPNASSLRSYLGKRGITPHLILLDDTMPDECGSDLLPELIATYPELPIIMMSGSSEIKNLISSYGNRVKFLAKPFAIHELQDLFYSLLKRDSIG